MTDHVRRAVAPELPPWLSLWVPLGLAVTPYAAKAVAGNAYETWIYHEPGLIENLTVVFLLGAVACGVTASRRAGRTSLPWFRWWILLLVAGSIYFLGEEISWGQHYFGWETPEAWNRYNPQGETNLHNVAGIFDQVPRNLAGVATFAGGIALPLARRLGLLTISPSRPLLYWLSPTIVCTPSAILILAVTAPAKLAKGIGTRLPEALTVMPGEDKELFLAFFLFLYLLSLLVRLSAGNGREGTRMDPRASGTFVPIDG